MAGDHDIIIVVTMTTTVFCNYSWSCISVYDYNEMTQYEKYSVFSIEIVEIVHYEFYWETDNIRMYNSDANCIQLP